MLISQLVIVHHPYSTTKAKLEEQKDLWHRAEQCITFPTVGQYDGGNSMAEACWSCVLQIRNVSSAFARKFIKSEHLWWFVFTHLNIKIIACQNGKAPSPSESGWTINKPFKPLRKLEPFLVFPDSFSTTTCVNDKETNRVKFSHVWSRNHLNNVQNPYDIPWNTGPL